MSGSSFKLNELDELDELDILDKLDELDKLDDELLPGVWAEEDGAPQEGVQGGGQCARHCSLIFILFKSNHIKSYDILLQQNISTLNMYKNSTAVELW